jgi:hypothetical protein
VQAQVYTKQIVDALSGDRRMRDALIELGKGELLDQVGSIERPALFLSISTSGHLPSGAAVWFRVEVAGGEVGAHLLVGSLDELRVVENVLYLFGGGVAANVLFLHYISQVRPLADAVADVLKYLLFSLGTGPAAKEYLPERLLCFSHASTFRSHGPP